MSFKDSKRGDKVWGETSHLYVGGVQQQISERGVMLGGEDVVLGVNDVQAERAELLHLHRLPSVLAWLQKVPEVRTIKYADIRKSHIQ